MRGEKNKCNNTWTTARYFAFIRSALRRAWSKYPVKYQVLNAAKRPSKLEDKRTKWEYQCNACKGWFKSKEVQVDHVVGAGTLTEYAHLPAFVERLFCEADNLQVLCTACHKAKTAEDRENAKGTTA